MTTHRVAIVGGGASGLVAAIEAARLGANVTIFESNDQLGRKILSTGNGKCNLSNENAEGVEEVQDFFTSLGVLFRNDEGRLYPYSEQAKSLRDILVGHVEKLGIEVRLKTSVEKIVFDDFTFYITSEGGCRVCEFDHAVLATGGKAAPQLGANDSGYRLAKELDHTVAAPHPPLVPFVYTPKEKERLKKLKGVRAKANITLLDGDLEVDSSRGEVQFTDYGVSGICVFDLSTKVRSISRDNMVLNIDFIPEYEVDDLADIDIRSIVNSKLTEVVTKPSELKTFRVNVEGTKGWKEAQVTSGGVVIDDIDIETMESRIIPGLYFAGEVIDKDFPCGGYNLNWAWLTGIKAGRSACD